MIVTESLMRELIRREQRQTISFFGLDLIITPENQVKLVEINGANSGSQGLKELTGKDISREVFQYLDKFYALPIFRFGSLINAEYPWFVVKFDEEEFVGDFRCVAPPELSNFVLPMHPPSHTPARGIVWNHLGNSYILNENHFLVVNPFAVERATNDKRLLGQLLNGDFDLRPKSCRLLEDYIEHDLTEAIDSSPTEYFVIKPVDEIQGKKILVVSKEDLVAKLKEGLSPVAVYRINEEESYEEPSLLLEELIPSKEIYSTETGKEHYGCMRYLVLVESGDGIIEIKHFGGYWRLAPGDVNCPDLNKRLIANYSNGAIPAEATDTELDLVKATVDDFLSTLYRRLLRLPLNERSDDIPLQDYCF